jgi:hypothetical protein
MGGKTEVNKDANPTAVVRLVRNTAPPILECSIADLAEIA